MLRSWPAPGGSEEYAVQFGRGIGPCLLVLPALFDEGNETRHFTVEVMRTLDRAGIDSVLPDLPGCNESPAPLVQQDVTRWREAAAEAAQIFGCSHVLAIRAGAILVPDLPGWSYAPLAGKSCLRSLLRARVIAAREQGRTESIDSLLAEGRQSGLVLAGYELGAAMIGELSASDAGEAAALANIAQAQIGGTLLWLRAEPDHDPAQAEALAAHIAGELA